MNGEQPLVRLKGVSKIFETEEVETHALLDVDLRIEEGELLSIVGPLGSGKSTLVSILALLDTPTRGGYRLNGADVGALDAKQRARTRNREIGLLCESPHLIQDLSIAENVELPLTYREMQTVERRRLAEEALERVGLAHRMHQYPRHLSNGQQQRLAVARAVVGAPSILLADEPTAQLDSASGEAVMDLLKELHMTGSTLCVATHDERWARYATRSVQLFDGMIA